MISASDLGIPAAIVVPSRLVISLKELVEKEMVSLSLPITEQFFLYCFSEFELQPKVRSQKKSYELARSLVGAGEGHAIMIMRLVTERAYNGNGFVYIPTLDDLPKAQYGSASANRAISTELVKNFSDMYGDLAY